MAELLALDGNSFRNGLCWAFPVRKEKAAWAPNSDLVLLCWEFAKSLGMGCKAKHRKQRKPSWCLRLPWKLLVQPQGKLFPAMQMFPVLAMHSTKHLSSSQSFPNNQPGLPSCGRVTPPVTLPQLLLCFCQLARATHFIPQGRNKGTNAQLCTQGRLADFSVLLLQLLSNFQTSGNLAEKRHGDLSPRVTA